MSYIRSRDIFWLDIRQRYFARFQVLVERKHKHIPIHLTKLIFSCSVGRCLNLFQVKTPYFFNLSLEQHFFQFVPPAVTGSGNWDNLHFLWVSSTLQPSQVFWSVTSERFSYLKELLKCGWLDLKSRPFFFFYFCRLDDIQDPRWSSKMMLAVRSEVRNTLHWSCRSYSVNWGELITPKLSFVGFAASNFKAVQLDACP